MPPFEPPQQERREPAGAGEDGGQCDNPTQQQMHRGGSAGWGPSPFGSLDVRERDERIQVQGQMPASSVVALLNQLCKQKPGGGFTLPKLPDLDYCLICGQGGTCLGPNCKGKQTPVSQKSKFLPPCFSTAIPGLSDSVSSSSVLTSRTMSSSSKVSIAALSTRSSLFNPKSNHKNPPKSSPQEPSNRSATKIQKPPREKTNPLCIMSDKLRQKLRKILLKTPINFHKTSKKVPEKMLSSGKFSSLHRKLSSSEERCMRKGSRSAAKSSGNFASFSSNSSVWHTDYVF